MPDENELHHIPLSFEEALQATVPKETVSSYINIVYGDCLEKLTEIEPDSIHLVVTDPPYFLDGLDDGWKKGRSVTTK